MLKSKCGFLKKNNIHCCRHRFNLAIFLLTITLALWISAGCQIFVSEPDVFIDPELPLSREHFIWLLVKGMDPDTKYRNPLAETTALALQRGYIESDMDMSEAISREEAAVIVAKLTEPDLSFCYEHYDWQIFDLDQASTNALTPLVIAYASGILEPHHGLIQPQQHLHLFEAESIIHRLLQPAERRLAPDIPAPYFTYRGLVEIARLDPDIVLDLKYATTDNFTHIAHYNDAVCLLREETAASLIAANALFKDSGFTIKIWDGYRSVSVQWALHNAAPDHLKAYVPAPSRYSQHAKGIAVDVTLVDRTGKEIVMPTDFDDFSQRAHSANPEISEPARSNRNYLIKIMQACGFTVSTLEWWHFYSSDLTNLPISNVELAEFIQARNEYYLEVIESHTQ